MDKVRTRWYKDTFIYQIYPRSFNDSNGDGIGDIRGIIQKLDYLKELGVGAVWLSPCYKSPNADNGYDISDYRDIMVEFGTLDDWKEMVDGMHKRGIKLIMDLVVNHTSDEHEWFIQSKSGKDNPYRDYYIWRKGKGKDGKKPPNNWTSRFGGPAWTYDESTGEWYLHLFNRKQPDLNWDNPKVRQEVKDIVKYWLDLGCDGFRCDVINYIGKADGLPNGFFLSPMRGDKHFTCHEKMHTYLHELNKEVLSKYDCMTVGEGPGVDIKQGLLMTSESREELDTIFHFEHVEVDTYLRLVPKKKLNLAKLKKIFSSWQDAMRDVSWNSLYYENHDQYRSIRRYAGDYGDKRVEAAKMLAVSIYFQQGTPYVYQGQEIGMTNYPFKDWDDFDDVLAKTLQNIVSKAPKFIQDFALKIMIKRARDHARTPMQWSDAENAGFTTGKPWFCVNPNYKEINVEQAMADENSIWNFYKKLIAFRRGNEIIKKGTYLESYAKSKDIYCYERSLNGELLFVICNFKNKEVDFKVPKHLAFYTNKLVLHNYGYDRKLENMQLRPYEAMVFHLNAKE
jgi:oligo-1,6-glucosidase